MSLPQLVWRGQRRNRLLTLRDVLDGLHKDDAAQAARAAADPTFVPLYFAAPGSADETNEAALLDRVRTLLALRA